MSKIIIPLTASGIIGVACLVFYVYMIMKKDK
jgi:hypothetical protein